jgi:hypothetical protein
MTKTQAQIVELIAQLPLAERRESIEHVQQTGLLDDSFYSRMTRRGGHRQPASIRN